MDRLEKFLIANHIPYYNSSMIKTMLDVISSNTYIIPGAILSYKTYNIMKDERLERNIDKLNLLLNMAPEGTIAYLVLHDTDKSMAITDPEVTDKISLVHIDNIDEVMIATYSFINKVPRIVKAMIHNGDIEDYIDDEKIYIPPMELKWASSTMTDDELSAMMNYVTDEEPTGYTVCITNSNKNREIIVATDIFEKFTMYYRDVSPKVHPIRLIDGVTSRCPHCNVIVYDDYIGSSACIACSKNKNM